MRGKNYSKQYVFPIGIWFEGAKRKEFEKINKQKIIYTGIVKPHMGVGLAIKAMPYILKEFPNAKLEIIGAGQGLEELKKTTVDYKVKNNVKFWGWVKERRRLETLLSDAALGIATFDTEMLKNDDSIKNADPAKLKDYMSAGLPVIMTNEISQAGDIVRAKAGFLINYNEKEFANLVIRLFKNPKLLKAHRQKALSYVRKFDYDDLFTKNLGRVMGI